MRSEAATSNQTLQESITNLENNKISEIKAGTNINISKTGTAVTISNAYSYSLPTATNSTKGGVYLNSDYGIQSSSGDFCVSALCSPNKNSSGKYEKVLYVAADSDDGADAVIYPRSTSTAVDLGSASTPFNSLYLKTSGSTISVGSEIS